MRRAALGCLLATLAACAPTDPIEITHAVVHPPIAGQDVAVGYFRIANHTRTPIEMIGARSNSARAIEFHTHVQDGDMLRMRRLPSVSIDAGERLAFQPGGHHLMLFGFAADDADRVEITIEFGNQGARSVEFVIEPRVR